MGEFIPIAVPDLRGNERKYLNACIDSNYVSTIGPFVDRFEVGIARATDATEAVATSTGTAGLHVALVAVGVEPGDLVIVPSLSFIASANAISYCGAEPWFLDVDPASWTLDATTLREALAQETEANSEGQRIHRETGKKVSAILPVYTLGVTANMDSVVATAQDMSIPVVADAAPALGATYRSRPLGKLGADLTVFSFNGNKTVTAGGGGAVIGDDIQLINRVRHLSTTARNGPDYDHDEVGFNYRMTNVQAAVGCGQLERLDELLAAKRSIRDRYDTAIASIDGLKTFPRPDWGDGSAWLSGFIVDPPNTARSKVLRECLRRADIDARPIWKPIHQQLPYQKMLRGTLSYTDEIWSNIVILPSSANLTTDQFDRVVSAITSAVSTA